MFPEGYNCPPDSVYRAGGGRIVEEAIWDEVRQECVVTEMHFYDKRDEPSVEEDRLAPAPKHTKARRPSSIWVSSTKVADACGAPSPHKEFRIYYRWDAVDGNYAHGVFYFNIDQCAEFQSAVKREKSHIRRALREHIASASTIVLNDAPTDPNCGCLKEKPPATDPES